MARVLVPTETFEVKKIGKYPIYGVLSPYIQKLIDYGLTPLLVTPIMKQKSIDDLYSLAQGLYLMGGVDIDPKFYSAKKHNKTDSKDQKRDTIEIALVKRALRDKKPILGLCRGSQILAVAGGGTLQQHVPDVVGHEYHSVGDKPYEALLENKHNIAIDANSRLHDILNKQSIQVTSGHHQAVATVGEDFEIVGTADGGITEAIEHNDSNYFCYAVQSHPEVEESGDLEPLFAAFAKAINRYGGQQK